MKVVIEPTDVFGIVYAILQVRRCVPLKNERYSKYGMRIAERCTRVVRTIGVRRGMGSRQLTKAEAAVFMTVALRLSFKASVLG